MSEQEKDGIESSLPFSEQKQSAILGHALNPDSGVFKYLVPVCRSSWFGRPQHGDIWAMMTKHYERYNKSPLPMEISQSPDLLKKELAYRNSVCELVNKATIDRAQWRPEVLLAELEDWIQAKLIQGAAGQIGGMFNRGNFKGIANLFSETVKKYHDVKLLQSNRKLFSSLGELIKTVDPSSGVPFGVGGIDNFLKPGNTHGGLHKPGQTLLIAPTNGGKTTTMLTVVVHNIRAGNLVCLMSHEDDDANIRLKVVRGFMSLIDLGMIQTIFGIDGDKAKMLVTFFRDAAADKLRFFDIITLSDTDPRRMYVAKLCEWIDKKIWYEPYNRPGMEVEEIVPIVERAQESCIDKNERGFDLFVNDYPGKLSTVRASKGNLQIRHIHEIVYEHFSQLALQHRWHSLVAIQTNRDGSKINADIEKSGRARFLRKEDAMEAWGPCTSAANIITINSSPTAKQRGIVHFYIDKSRSSGTGHVVSAYSRFNNDLSHADEFGWVSYDMGEEKTVILDTFMKPGQQKALTQAEVTGTIIKSEQDDE